ncbi:MAG: ATP-dependent zinc metalloprotease FtsH [Oscillospiraceae bacterium]|nr:ATP-dependent zinc metalloprotease FtsH [Candidatus Limimonas egerieequi]
MVALMVGLLWSALKVDTKKADDEYYQVIQYFDQGKVKEYDLNLGTRKLTYVLRGEKDKRTYTVPSYELFIADVHDDVREYNAKHPTDPIKMNYESGSSNYWISQMLPMVGMLVLMGIMLYWLVKKMGNTMMDDTKRTMAFGKARLKTGEDGRKTTFEDVAGLDEEKEDLEEIVEFLKNPQKFNDLGARIPKGVLLVGPPGTGKTLLARAVAGEADASFLSISGSDFVEMYVGVGASRVRDLFDNAKKNIPSIVFIDEIDAVGRQRGAGMGGGHDEREQTLNQLLVEMDGFGENAGVIIMAATNRPDILDPALLRPGRFDRQVTVNYPDVVGREAILKVHARNKPIGPDVRLDEIARATSGFTGADLENLLNEAALLSARRGKKAITKYEIEEATIKVVVGTEKKSKKITDDEKKLTAYHEAGHAITNFYLSTLDPVHQVSIIPRGMAGGYTMSLPKDDKSYMSKKQMLDEIVSLLGGRVAESIILGDISTGASNDIERATKIARNMIVKYGMSDKLGPISYTSGNEEVFIGRDYGHIKNYSEATASIIDEEIESIVNDAYARADEILRLHIDKLHLLAKYLMAYEKIDGILFEQLMLDPDFEKKLDSGEIDTTKTLAERTLERVELLAKDKEEIAPVPEEKIAEKIQEIVEEPAEPVLINSPVIESELSDDSLMELPEEVMAESEEEPLEPLFTDFAVKPNVVMTDEGEVELSEAELQLKHDIETGAVFFTDDSILASSTMERPDGEADITPSDSTVESEPETVEPEPVEEPEEEPIDEPIEEPEEPKEEAIPLAPIDDDFPIEEELLPPIDAPLPFAPASDEPEETLPVADNYEADINDYLSDEEKEPEKPKKAVIKKKGKKPVVKATPKKAEDKKSEPIVLEEPKEEKTHAPLVDDLPEGKFDYYEGDDDNGESVGTFTENDEIYALYELLKATRDIQDDEDGNPFAKKD